MGPYIDPEETGIEPRLGVLPILCLVKGKALEGFLNHPWDRFAEVVQTILNRVLYGAFNMIPGYDQILFSGPMHAKGANEGIAALNESLEMEGERTGTTLSRVIQSFEREGLEEIPLYQPFARGR